MHYFGAMHYFSARISTTLHYSWESKETRKHFNTVVRLSLAP